MSTNGEMTTLKLEELPYEIIQQILGYLPLSDLLPLTSQSKTFRYLTLSPLLTPFLAPVHRSLLRGAPYPPELAALGAYTHISRNVFLEILVRGEAKWILEEMEIPRLPDVVWEEAFSRRFLPSWKRYREGNEKWRATFLRMLRKLQHRAVGCTHEESWTRFLMLHRNGSGSLNRIYSRTFDPLDIFREIKMQNNFINKSTQVRQIVQLQDVRILLFGVLSNPQSLFINDNAFRLCHPPKMGFGEGGVGWEKVVDEEGYEVDPRKSEVEHSVKGKGVARRWSEAVDPVAAGFGLGDIGDATRARSMSVTDSGTRAMFASLSQASRLNSSVRLLSANAPIEPPSRPRTGSGSALGKLLRLGSSSARDNTPAEPAASASTSGSPLDRVRSNSGSGRRLWLRRVSSRDSQDDGSLGPSTPGVLQEVPEDSQAPPVATAEYNFPIVPDNAPAPSDQRLVFDGHSVRRRSADEAVAALRRTVSAGEAAAAGVSSEDANVPAFQMTVNGHAGTGRNANVAERAVPPTRLAYGYSVAQGTKVEKYDEDRTLPYRVMVHPTPSPSHALYPNYTPTTFLRTELAGSEGDTAEKDKYPAIGTDARQFHPILREKKWMEGVVKGGGKVIPSEYVERKIIKGEGRSTKVEKQGEVLTWIGPILLIAQIHPAVTGSRRRPKGSSAAPRESISVWEDGPCPPVDLGAPGMYASFEWEDLNAIAPWLKFGSEDPEAAEGRESAWGDPSGRRDGLGFGE